MGSGTFLVLAIKKIIKKSNLDTEEHLEGKIESILSNVIGFDINPIAVLSARTNYLIAISQLRDLGKSEIEIPIFMADSVLAPRTYASMQGVNYIIRTTVGEFRFHKSITNRENIAKVLEV